MKLFFLGTGAAEGIPALFCACDVCTEAKKRGGPEIRTRSTILIDDVIKIDLPPDTLAHVHSYPQICLADLQHLLFTHSHDDHFAVRELQYFSPNFAPSRKFPLDVWATQANLEKMYKEMAHFFEPAPLRVHPISPFEDFQVGHLRVTPLVARHKYDELCLNFVLRAPNNKVVLYASDTGWYDEPTWQFLTDVSLDAVIIECGKGNSDSTYDGHLSVEECVRIRTRLIECGSLSTDTPFYLTHLAHTGLLLHREISALAAPHNISIAYDGLEIEI